MNSFDEPSACTFNASFLLAEVPINLDLRPAFLLFESAAHVNEETCPKDSLRHASAVWIIYLPSPTKRPFGECWMDVAKISVEPTSQDESEIRVHYGDVSSFAKSGGQDHCFTGRSDLSFILSPRGLGINGVCRSIFRTDPYCCWVCLVLAEVGIRIRCCRSCR